MSCRDIDNISPPRTTNVKVPGELPQSFRNQHERHKEYKRRGPPSGDRHPDSMGMKRIKLSFRFDVDAPSSAPLPQTPPPPSSHPPPPSSAPQARLPSTTAPSRRPHKRRVTTTPGSRRRKVKNRGPRNVEPVTVAAPVRPVVGEGRNFGNSNQPIR